MKRGRQLFGQVDRPKMTEDFVAAANWLRARPDSTGRLGAVGFCFGGGIVNTLAVRMPDDLRRGRAVLRRARRAPRTCRRSRRAIWCTTASSTRGWLPAGPRTMRR